MRFWSVFIVLSLGFWAYGSVGVMGSQIIDFTAISKDDPRITFEPADKLTLTKLGLGWDGEAAASYDGSFTTAPEAVGMAWRPLTQITLGGTISPPPQTFEYGDKQKSKPWRGQLFARYSPDKKHWSTWQALQIVTEPKEDDKGTKFFGTLQVPEIQRKEYLAFYDQYVRLDVPWKSDEEAMVKWILEKQPEFFANHLPFIGYIQYHFEAPFHGGQRLKAFEYQMNWGISGISMIPKDPDAMKKSQGPWRFDVTKDN